jgi:hypothetical protein
MEIMVEFIMFAEEFPVDKVRDRIGIDGCKIDKKGDVALMGQYKQLSRIETHTSILYTTGYIETIDVKDPIEQIHDMLLPREKEITECVEKYSLTAKFCVVINITDNPAISLSREFIALAAKLHAEIEFDTYLDIEKEVEIED